jgi:hypothetical protein
MTECNTELSKFPRLSQRTISADFNGGDITSDGGLPLIAALDKKLKLTESVAALLPDKRDQSHCNYSMRELLRQRVYALAAGYEDLNDHEQLRYDLSLQTSVGRREHLSSSSTLCRLENSATREHAVLIHQVIIEQFIKSFDKPPAELILDFDATDDRVYGNQEKKFFHGYYDHYCFLPLYVFCGEQLLVSYLRPARIDGAKHAGAILKLLVQRLRTEWPDAKIIYRGDSGFCREKVLLWCDLYNVDYIVGYAKNPRVSRHAQNYIDQAEEDHHESGCMSRIIGDFEYKALKWKGTRRTIIRIQHDSKGANPRFIVTSLPNEAGYLYDDIYCARGDMENRIKEQQLDLFADRTSCNDWWANQFRLMLSSLAYNLMERLRNLLLIGTRMAKAQCGTIRLKLIKVAAVMTRNTRKVYFHYSESYAHKTLFALVWKRLSKL